MMFRTKKEQLDCVKQICKRDLFTLCQQSSRMLPLLIVERLPPPEDGPGDPRVEEHTATTSQSQVLIRAH